MASWMGHQDTLASSLNAIIEAILNGTCTEEPSLQLARLGPEAVQLAVLAATRKCAQLKGRAASVHALRPEAGL